MSKEFIRFGEIPKDGKSKIHFHNSIIGEEIGVSCYRCFKDYVTGKYVLLYPEVATKYTEDDYLDYLYYRSEKQSVYLLTGLEVGIGSDGEPLLKDIKIIRKLSYFKDLYREQEDIQHHWSNDGSMYSIVE